MLDIIKHNLKFTDDNFGHNKPNKIIIHHALSKKCTIQDIHKWHIERGFKGIGYHFFIGKAGTIHQGRLISQEGAHCVGQNNQSIGICLEGCYTDYQDQTEKVVPKKQLDSLIKITKEYKLPFFYHRDFTKEKDCPGKYFLTKNELYKLLDPEKLKTMPEILSECTQDGAKWTKFVDDCVKIAKQDSNLGFLEQAIYLPDLIRKIYYHK